MREVSNIPNGWIPANGDLGGLSLSFFANEVDVDIFYTIEIGFTDETRLGFHCIAPLVSRVLKTNTEIETPGRGNLTSANLWPTITLNKFLYFTRV
jgi:hypothetical protein